MSTNLVYFSFFIIFFHVYCQSNEELIDMILEELDLECGENETFRGGLLVPPVKEYNGS